MSVAVQIFGMNARIARQKPIGGIAASMNGRRRPIGVLNVSLHGPITSGSVSAKTPSAASTAAIIVLELVNRSRRGGRYAAVVVIEKARPNAPSPRIQTSPRRPGISTPSPDEHALADDLHDRALRRGDLVVSVRQLPEHPACEDLLDRAVKDPREEPRVEVGSEVPLRLTARHDPLDRLERLAKLVDLALHLRAARHLAHEDADEVRVAAPGPEQDRRDLA